MSDNMDRYVSPLSERYASREMQYIFSPDMKFRTWRRLWIALAETEKELGLPITEEQIAELKAHAEDINYEAVSYTHLDVYKRQLFTLQENTSIRVMVQKL